MCIALRSDVCLSVYLVLAQRKNNKKSSYRLEVGRHLCISL